MTTAEQQIFANIAEYKRLCHLTTFQRINRRVEQRRQQTNAAQHLHPTQLDDDADAATLTIVAFSMDTEQPAGRSTQRTAQALKAFVVIHRPCERHALDHLRGYWLYDDELPPVPVYRPAQKRWCIWCKTRHPHHDFIRHARYLHGLSYACAESKRLRKRQRWLLSA